MCKGSIENDETVAVTHRNKRVEGINKTIIQRDKIEACPRHRRAQEMNSGLI